MMKKHSKKEKAPRSLDGFSKGKKNDAIMKHLGPIIIENILMDTVQHSKDGTMIHEISIHTNPADDKSSIIKRHFKPLNNPKTV